VVVDQTGVGQAVVDVLARSQLAAALGRVVITGGRRTSRSGCGAWRVPKKELVSCLQWLLRSRRLWVAALPERQPLIREMLVFRAKVTAAAQETFGARRERGHDDLVLAVALAAWWGERNGGPRLGEVGGTCERLGPWRIVLGGLRPPTAAGLLGT
jgi:hypothetical protein